MRTSYAPTFALAIFTLLALPALAFASQQQQSQPHGALPWQWAADAGDLGGFVAPESAGPVLSTENCTTQCSSDQPAMLRSRMLGPSRRVATDGSYIVEYSVVEEDGKPYLLERRREVDWHWNFPRRIGLLGFEFSGFTKLDHKDGAAGMFFRHLASAPGPLFYGFEITPFSFGAVYDNNDFAALYSFQTRALGLLRLYLGSSSPSFYFELGAGLQFVAFRTADEFATIYENGYPREEFSRWRAATRLAFGIELGAFGLEIGWTGIFPTMEFEYSAHNVNDEITKATVNGAVYLTATFRVGERR